MKYKVIIADFDHTLADSDGNVSQKVKDVVVNYIQKGGIFTIATGRPYFGPIKNIAGELNLMHPVIAHGGGIIINPVNDELEWKQAMDAVVCDYILSKFEKESIYYAAEGLRNLYTPDGKPIGFYGDDSRFKHIKDRVPGDVLKIIIPASIAKLKEEHINRIKEDIISELSNVHVVKTRVKDDIGLDVTAEKASKHLAILEFLKIVGIDRMEVIGIGDGYNDYPLLTACGLKVAMGNAVQDLKDIADYIAPSVDDDGVVDVINKFVLER